MKNFIIISLVILLAGCRASLKPDVVQKPGQKVVEISKQQITAVDGALKEILAETQRKSFKVEKALVFAEQPGLHVCGYTKIQSVSGGSLREVPFYVEFEGEASETVKRGQVGLDQSKLSKVKFVCRHHFGGL